MSPGLRDLRGAAVLVVGLGSSGTAAARALTAAGADVRVADGSTAPEVAERAETLRASGIPVQLGALTPELLDGVALVVPSPGVPPATPLLAAAAARGVPVWSEPELAWRLSRGHTRLIPGGPGAYPRLVAVTGTNGKTTTVELLAACLDAPAGGNIGSPLVDLLTTTSAPLVVAELSSFQLHYAGTLRPDVAVLLNIAPDHLDWHGDLVAYRAAKARIWANQRAGRPRDWAVLNADDPGVLRTREEHPPPGGVLGFTLGEPGPGQVGVIGDSVVERITSRAGEQIARVADLRMRGPHNLANATAAVAAALAAGGAHERIAAALRAFSPGAHRLAQVAESAGVTWVNDSKATNPHAAAAALEAVGDRPVLWIAGGLDKGLDFSALAAPVRRTVRLAITIGTTGPALAALARDWGVPAIEAGDLATAVAAAAERAHSGDVVLLAPACASMDQFRDYAERGRAFAELVQGLVTDAEVVRGGG